MKQYILDAERFNGVESFYDEATLVFGFPGYFWRNLDALYDSLSDIGEPIEVIWKNSEKSRNDFVTDATQPGFFGQVVRTMQDVFELTLRLE